MPSRIIHLSLFQSKAVSFWFLYFSFPCPLQMMSGCMWELGLRLHVVLVDRGLETALAFIGFLCVLSGVYCAEAGLAALHIGEH